MVFGTSTHLSLSQLQGALGACRPTLSGRLHWLTPALSSPAALGVILKNYGRSEVHTSTRQKGAAVLRCVSAIHQGRLAERAGGAGRCPRRAEGRQRRTEVSGRASLPKILPASAGSGLHAYRVLGAPSGQRPAEPCPRSACLPVLIWSFNLCVQFLRSGKLPEFTRARRPLPRLWGAPRTLREKPAPSAGCSLGITAHAACSGQKTVPWTILRSCHVLQPCSPVQWSLSLVTTKHLKCGWGD